MGTNKSSGRLENIAVLNRNIVVEGCTFTKTGLSFDRTDPDTLARASACLQEMDNCGDWWWGDYLVAYAQGRLEADNDSKHLAAMDEQTQEQHRRAYVRNHGSVVTGKQKADTQIERYKVAKFYNCGRRLPQLSNDHHREAMDGCGGDLAVAQDWLDKAANAEPMWSSNALRSEMKAAKRAGISDPPQRQTVTQHELFGAQRWANVQIRRVDDMDVEEKQAMLAQLKPILELATALAAALGMATLPSESAPTPGGKESLLRAS